MPLREDRMDITVIDDTDEDGGFDAAGFFGSLTTVGEVYMVGVSDMVNNVLAAAKWQKIRRLRIVDHGSYKEVKKDAGKASTRCKLQFGNTKVEVANFAQFAKTLAKLNEKFYDKSHVHLAHCYAGKDHELLRLFAKAWQVPVYAGTGKRAQWSRTQFGDLVVCSPGGKVQKAELPA